jgi:hypothetical protein
MLAPLLVQREPAMTKMDTKKWHIVEEAFRERRRFRRVRLSRIGRAFIVATSEEVPCMISDISADGANVRCKFARKPSGNAVIHIGELGQYEGRIMTASDKGFTMRFSCSRKKRNQLADLLTVELNRHVLKNAAAASK